MGPSCVLTPLLSRAAGWGSVGYTLGHNHRTQFHPLSPVVNVKGPLCPQKCPPQPEDGNQPQNPRSRGEGGGDFSILGFKPRPALGKGRSGDPACWDYSTPAPAGHTFPFQISKLLGRRLLCRACPYFRALSEAQGAGEAPCPAGALQETERSEIGASGKSISALGEI